MGTIYVVRRLRDGRSYVGQTRRSVERRWKEHVEASRRPRTHLARAVALEGSSSFVVEQLQTVDDRLLDRAEIFWIAELGTYGRGGFNETRGGDGCRGYAFTPEDRARMAAVHVGKKDSVETRRKKSEALKGLSRSVETRLRQSAAKVGEKNATSRMTWESVEIIRSSRDRSQRSLAKELGVSQGTICRILRNEIWKI